MSEFRNRGLEVVIDTTKEAELGFALLSVPAEDQEYVAASLKAAPFSSDDTCIGLLRIRCIKGKDIGFTVSPDGSVWVVTIFSVDLEGQLESRLKTLLRAGVEQLAPGVRVLLEGRKKE